MYLINKMIYMRNCLSKINQNTTKNYLYFIFFSLKNRTIIIKALHIDEDEVSGL